MRSSTNFFALALTIVVSLPAASQRVRGEEPPAIHRPEILVLGTYHMANPGRDVFNTEADDVLSPKRQAEIEEVVATLEKFHPTKIALEASFDRSGTIDQRYADYLAGKQELTRNERQQLGFRLAKKLGHEKVYSVDVEGEFPYMRLVNYIKAAELTEEFEALNRSSAEDSESFSAYLASHTVQEALLVLNSEEKVAESLAWYFRVARFGEDWDWPGADLVADWFRRNMRIYNQIARLADSPGERVLVIYGAGHLGWLQFAIDSNPDLRLRDLADLTD